MVRHWRWMLSFSIPIDVGRSRKLLLVPSDREEHFAEAHLSDFDKTVASDFEREIT